MPSSSSSCSSLPPPPPVSATGSASGFILKPTYVDIVNSQDIKCLLPVGTVAYGGTYQFAVLNTGAPKEANRDVLELPERFSGDGAGGNTGVVGPGGRGRRITREIEHVICADGGQQALIMCADGGVVFYNSSSEVVGDVVGGNSARHSPLPSVVPSVAEGSFEFVVAVVVVFPTVMQMLVPRCGYVSLFLPVCWCLLQVVVCFQVIFASSLMR